MQGEGVYEEEVWHNGFPNIKKVAGHIEGIDHVGFDDEEIYITIEGIQCELCDVKLYLRPMSSMTESEEATKCAFLDDIEGGVEDSITKYVDWQTLTILIIMA